jgi:uncharacterized membrane protein
MTSPQIGRRRAAENLAAQLDRWVRDQLLTDEQARRILALEQAPGTDDAPSARAGGRLVVEALAYLGGVIALAAGLLLVQLVWPDLSVGVRLAVPLSAAAVLLLSGLLVPGDAPERKRMRGALWALAAAAWMSCSTTPTRRCMWRSAATTP